MFYQVISLTGAVLILAAYLALQLAWMQSDSRWFNLLNFVGSALLAWVAIVDQRVGFIVLESAWAVLSAGGMLRRKRPQN